jgi:hypothetical protein
MCGYELQICTNAKALDFDIHAINCSWQLYLENKYYAND